MSDLPAPGETRSAADPVTDPGPGADEADGGSLPRAVAAAGQTAQLALDRLASFRIFYIAIFVFLLLYVASMNGLELGLRQHFRSAAVKALHDVGDMGRPIPEQVHAALRSSVTESIWVKWGGVRVAIHVFGADGRVLVLNGVALPYELPPHEIADPVAQAARMLPATAQVDDVSIPIASLLSTSVMILYAALLLQTLFLYNRSLARRQTAIVARAQQAQRTAARRAQDIETELDQVREHLGRVEPAEQEHAAEIRSLEGERRTLQQQLARVATREQQLRSKAERAVELDEERQALEELLGEAVGDLDTKNDEIRELERSLKQASRTKTKRGGKTREAEIVARRLRTLYKNIEIDDRVIDDLVALGDESMKLRAEEGLKRLADEAENVAVRRKVGGLPPQLSIFELGFAGRGRIYYTKGQTRRFRVLLIGAKNSQKPDLEYLSRLDP